MCFRLIEGGKVVITTAVMHVDDIFASGEQERCGRFGRGLGEMALVKNLGELRLYAGCVYGRDREAGLLSISQQTYGETMVAEYRVRNVLSVDTRLHEVEGGMDVPEENEFRELVGVFDVVGYPDTS